jgi:toxin FitB
VKFLLDTNVISEMRKPRPHGAVEAWFLQTPHEQIGIPAIVIGELQGGAEITRKQDPQKAAELELWIDGLPDKWTILSMDAAIAREWAKLVERRNRSLFEDAMIAATARIHNLIVVTRNTKDFESFDVEVLNPFHFK